MHFSSKVLWCHELNLHQVHFLPSGIPSTSFPTFPMFSDFPLTLELRHSTPPYYSEIPLQNPSRKSTPTLEYLYSCAAISSGITNIIFRLFLVPSPVLFILGSTPVLCLRFPLSYFPIYILFQYINSW
jgi:hypothetical protein